MQSLEIQVYPQLHNWLTLWGNKMIFVKYSVDLQQRELCKQITLLLVKAPPTHKSTWHSVE